MKRPKVWGSKQRDSHPSLTLSDYQEAAITRARFIKAQLLATVMYDEGVTYEIGCAMSGESWDILQKIARVNEPSPSTRVLALELLRDRTAQREKR